MAVVAAVLLAGMIPAPGTAADDAEAAPTWRGRWDTEAELTIEPRTDASVAVAPGLIPHGVAVWGGVAEDGRLLNDGVLIDSRRPYHWRVMPEAPLVPRRDYGWAFVDDRVYVWGGVDAVGDPLDDGAEFQHGWTALPPSGLPGGPASMTVAGNRLWVVVADPETGLAKIESAHLPVEEAHGWGLVADVPLPVGERYEVIGCCGDGGDELIVLSVQADGSAVPASWGTGAARNPSFIGGAWTQLGSVPGPIDAPVVGHAIEQELAAWASAPDPAVPASSETEHFAVLRQLGWPDRERWRTPDAPAALTASSGLVLSPRHLISVGDRAAYDLAAERWLRLPERGHRAGFGTPDGATSWWDHGRLWVFGGKAPDGTMRSDLWTFTPRLPKGTYTLPIGYLRLWKGDAGKCYYQGRPGSWTLRGDPRARPRVWMQQGARTEPLQLPDGWHAHFGRRLTITDSTGAVGFREGETCEGNTGTGG